MKNCCPKCSALARTNETPKCYDVPWCLSTVCACHHIPAVDPVAQKALQEAGFEADTGVTGRKIAVDSYGPRVPIGGGAFSGKDASKVDRSAAYMARKIAVDILKQAECEEVFIRLAYAIGKAEPLEVSVIADGLSIEYQEDDYDLTPNGIIKFLDLKKPQFAETAKWGHFGNGFKWDK